jgi:putative ABC transport system permease protein
MIASFLKTGVRAFVRRRLYTVINIIGLSLGICAAIGIYLYVTDELSYDQFHREKENIYRISTTYRLGENANRYASTSAPLAESIRSAIAGVENVCRLYGREASVEIANSKNRGEKYREPNVFFADPTIFQVFDFKFLRGKEVSALPGYNSLVISKSIAEKYFGNVANAVGRDILFEGKVMLTITSVIEDYPEQSHFRPDLIVHFENYFSLETPEIQQYLRNDWLYNPLFTYVLISPGTDLSSVEIAMNEIVKRNSDERVASGTRYSLQPITDIHLHSDFTFADTPAIRYVWILSAIGVLILVIACVNFVNLSTVHSLMRAREIGVRKVMGAGRRDLIIQFLSESFLLVVVSFVLALGFLYTLLPMLSEVSGKTFTFDVLSHGKMILGALLIFFLTTVLAATYPSLYIMRFNPVKVLKGFTASTKGEGAVIRRVLVVIQFTVSITLVIMAVVFYRQMNFLKSKPLGFQKDNLITIPLFSDNPNSILGGGVDGPLRARMNSFEEEVLKHAAMEAITASSALPGIGFMTNALIQTDSIKADDNVFAAVNAVDYDFIETFGMEVVAGRGFSRSFGTDHVQAFVINERAVEYFRWKQPEDAIGKSMEVMGKKGTVVGFVKDFHFQQLQQPLRPLVMEVSANKFAVFSVRVNEGASLEKSVDELKTVWNNFFPEKVFEFRFLDDQLQQGYDQVQRLGTLMQYFSFLAMFISALGVFGLAAYLNHQRLKEICIRKVLGAGAGHLFYILSREFVRLILIAFVIGIPVAWWLASSWLDSFAYRTTVGGWSIIAGGVTVLLTVTVAIGYEAIRSIKTNPVDKLHSE